MILAEGTRGDPSSIRSTPCVSSKDDRRPAPVGRTSGTVASEPPPRRISTRPTGGEREPRAEIEAPSMVRIRRSGLRTEIAMTPQSETAIVRYRPGWRSSAVGPDDPLCDSILVRGSASLGRDEHRPSGTSMPALPRHRAQRFLRHRSWVGARTLRRRALNVMRANQVTLVIGSDDAFLILAIASRLGWRQGASFDGIHETNGLYTSWQVAARPVGGVTTGGDTLGELRLMLDLL